MFHEGRGFSEKRASNEIELTFCRTFMKLLTLMSVFLNFLKLSEFSCLFLPSISLNNTDVEDKSNLCIHVFSLVPLVASRVLTWFLQATMTCCGAAEALFDWTSSVSVLRPG